MSFANVYIGRPIERVEDLRVLRGRGRFVDDLSREGVLRAAILRSPVAHGRIRSIDVTAACALPGVHAVITAADIGRPLPRIPIRFLGDPSMTPFLQPVLADGRVRYVGEPIALVVADSAAIAEDAADLVELDIEPLPAIVDREAAGRNEVLLFEEAGTNVAIRYDGVKGDAEAAFRNAPYVRRERFSVQRHFACPMEPRGILADWDAEAGRMTVLGAAKVLFQNRVILSSLIGVPVENIDSIEGDTGGSFGARGEFYPEDFLVPYAAQKLGRPVQWTEDRREHLMATNHSRECDCDIEIACELDGTIRGLRGTAWIDGGAYVRTHGGTNAFGMAYGTSGPFRIPNYHLVTEHLLTNKTPIGTYRGPSKFESDFFRERLFDIAAGELGIDPLDFRRRNLLTPQELPHLFPTVTPGDRGDTLDNGDYRETLDRCVAEIGWAERADLQGKLVNGRYHGLGLACFVELGGSGPSENARIVLKPDGDVAVSVGSAGVGQGAATILSQIAADALELPMDRITVSLGSTSGVKQGYGSFGSRSTVMGGNAIALAATSFRESIKAAAAPSLGCKAVEVEIVDGRARGPTGKSLEFAELAEAAIAVEETFFNTALTWAYGAAAAYVAVDPQTGQVEVLDYVAVEDAGRIINPLTLRGQLIGAIVQGLGGALLEHLVYDGQGQLLTGTFADYLLPTAGDFPNIRGVELENYPAPSNPLGVKGAGEGGIMSPGAAIGNAVAAALACFEVQPNVLPLSPPRVWQLIEDARKKAAM